MFPSRRSVQGVPKPSALAACRESCTGVGMQLRATPGRAGGAVATDGSTVGRDVPRRQTAQWRQTAHACHNTAGSRRPKPLFLVWLHASRAFLAAAAVAAAALPAWLSPTPCFLFPVLPPGVLQGPAALLCSAGTAIANKAVPLAASRQHCLQAPRGQSFSRGVCCDELGARLLVRQCVRRNPAVALVLGARPGI